MKICKIEGCDNIVRCKNLCRGHYLRLWRNNDVGSYAIKKIAPKGSARFKDINGYIRINVDGKYVLEHRFIMESILERKLLNDETVHHINGDRTDNRVDNLELWTSHQPKGQRVEDLLQYARDIIKLYG